MVTCIFEEKKQQQQTTLNVWNVKIKSKIHVES